MGRRPGGHGEERGDLLGFRRSGPPVRLDKVKRPGGVFSYGARAGDEDRHGTWLHLPAGSPWSAPHDDGVLPLDALALLRPDRWWVTWWIDDPSARRIEVDVCTPPTRTAAGWRFVDLELDVKRLEPDRVEVEDEDEFADACRSGHIAPADAAAALAAVRHVTTVLVAGEEPWGHTGWDRLDRYRGRRPSGQPR